MTDTKITNILNDDIVDLTTNIISNENCSNYVVNYDGSSSISVLPQEQIHPVFEIMPGGDIKIGNLQMPVEDLEACLRFLYALAKEKEPEFFI